MDEMNLNRQIANYRRRCRLTQEDVAKALNVTNQAVSKWESGQCCPDIQLLPELARLFGVSTDELLGTEKAESEMETIKSLVRRMEALPEAKAVGAALQIARALHGTVLSKVTSMPAEKTGEIIDRAMSGEVSASCVNQTGLTTLMRGGTVFFSDGKTRRQSAEEIGEIGERLRTLADADVLCVLFALSRAAGEDTYASIEAIAEESGMEEAKVNAVLHRPLGKYVEWREDAAHPACRVQEKYMQLPPLLTLLADF